MARYNPREDPNIIAQNAAAAEKEKARRERTKTATDAWYTANPDAFKYNNSWEDTAQTGLVDTLNHGRSISADQNGLYYGVSGDANLREAIDSGNSFVNGLYNTVWGWGTPNKIGAGNVLKTKDTMRLGTKNYTIGENLNTVGDLVKFYNNYIMETANDTPATLVSVGGVPVGQSTPSSSAGKPKASETGTAASSGLGTAGAGTGSGAGTGNPSGPAAGNAAGYTPLGQYNDADLPVEAKTQIEYYKSMYDQYMAQGDTAKAGEMHALAEAVRAQYGYSGGSDGSDYLPFGQQVQQTIQTSVNAPGNIISAKLPTATTQEEYINSLYDAQQEAALAALKAAYDQNVITLDEQAAKIPLIYDQTRNQAAANAEVSRANFNESAAASGMNTGAASQVRLSQENAKLANLNAINLKQAEAVQSVETERLRVKTQYQNEIAQAIINGEFERAQALYDDAIRVDNSIVQTALNQANLDLSIWNANMDAQMNALAITQQKAETLASYGDFSGYSALGYSADQIANMEAVYKAVNNNNLTNNYTNAVIQPVKTPDDEDEETNNETGNVSVKDAPGPMPDFGTAYALNTTDAMQKGGTSAEIQRGIDKLYERGLIKDDSLKTAGETEAKYRTFQDNNNLSKFAVGVRNLADELGSGFGTAAVPFAKTPTNLAVRATEYSPVGIAQGMVDLARVFVAARKGNLTAAQQAKAVQRIGRGLNGTALIYGVAALALKDIIRVVDTGGEDKDKDRSALDKMLGQYGTQFNLSALLRWSQGEDMEWRNDDVLISIAFLEPMNAMMTTGALIAEDIKADKLTLGRLVLDSMSGALQSLLDMPMLSPFRDAANASQYSDAETVAGRTLDAAAQYAASMPSSFIPNSIKGIAQGTDEYQRDMYTGDTVWERTMDSLFAGIPGLRQKLPAKQDSYGRDVKSEEPVLNFLNSNILPGSVSRYKLDEITEILMDVNKATGNNSVFPNRKAINNVTAGGEKYELNAQDKREYQQVQGTTFVDTVEALSESPKFGDLTNEQKADIISDIVIYSGASARKDFLKKQGVNYEMSGEARTIEKAMALDPLGIDIGEFFVLKDKHDEIAYADMSANQKAAKFANYLDDLGWLNDRQRNAVANVLVYASGFTANADKYHELTKAGLSSTDAWNVYDAVSTLQPLPGKDKVSDQQQIDAVAAQKMSDADKLEAVRIFSEDKYSKYATANAYGISVELYNKYEQKLAEFNKESTTITQNECRSALESFDATNEQKAFLYAITKKTWTSGNPYGTVYGNRLEWVVLDEESDKE